ncbi:MAG: undecaprenyl-phosphate alpha-N-acetylglucosaminyl 1-phosphate transferase, partial [Flavobacteriaceae bacterium]|nr:undecaprenyl-phosphate alpha-N-acetylglucosaminyl 1-phosphate transferase [Flavobacteriaceae bacterium]
MENVLPLFSNPFLLGLFAIVTGFGLAYKILPVIIFLAHKKNLMDEPKKRSAHLKKLPNLGGVGIFIAITISITVFGSLIELVLPQFKQLLVLFGAITILFFLGLKDDLTGLSYIKKFGGQTIAACLVVLLTDIRISNFGGLFGIYELPYFISVLFSILLFVYLINAFNLIDGIDGLAGSIAIVSCSIFGLFFLLNGHALLALVSLSMIGALVGFLKYNLSKSPKKLFMGDSGSLFIGFLLCYQAIAFINAPSIEAISVSNKLIIA